MNLELPTLNDIAPSWADIKTSITPHGGSLIDTIDYSAINWDSQVEIGMQRGASGGRVMKRTTGQKTDSASGSFYKSGLRKLLLGLMELAPQRGNQRLVGLVHFDILIQYTPPGSVDIFEAKLKGCRLSGLTNNAAEGTDALVVETALNPVEIVELINGVEVLLI